MGKSYSIRVKETRIQEQERLKALDRKIDEMWESPKRTMNIRNYLYCGIYVTVSALPLYFVALNVPLVLQLLRAIFE